jgi:streptogramin lyase/type II secretory pathway pseudopilin PulG
MRWLNKVVRTGRRQDGFTVAEVLIAVLIMAISTIGLLGMFESSLQLSGLAGKSKDAKRLARTVSERIRAMPFYEPYAGHNGDIDDSFWGTDVQRGGNITNNVWETAPYQDYVQDLDPRYTCQVKMAYVLDDLSNPNMKADWVPEASSAEWGKDNPLSVNSDVFHIIKYEVKVSWEAKLAGGRTVHKSESYTTLMSDTEFQANLGVNAMINTGTSGQWGTGGQNSNTAPHDVGNIPIKITGYGFKAGQTTASLVMQGVDDIPIYGIGGTGPVTWVDDKTLTGSVNLSTGTDIAITPPPWKPRRDPGKWTVKVNVGVVYAFANEAFTVEFPRPRLSAINPTKGYNNKINLTGLGALGYKVLNLGVGSSPYTSYTGATIILVNTLDPNVVIEPNPDMPITYGAGPPAGYSSLNAVTVQFDLRGATPGRYYVEVANCKNNRVTLKPGDVSSVPSGAYIFTISAATTEFLIPTAISGPIGITVGPDGNLWFTEDTGNKIGRITTGGTITEFTVPTGSSSPYGITAGPDGNLWFTEFNGNKIGRVNLDPIDHHVLTPNITEFTVPTGEYPIGITAGPDGNLWFTEYVGDRIGRVNLDPIDHHVLTPNITEFTIPTGGSFPNGITAGPDGNLWFTEELGNKIGRVNLDPIDHHVLTPNITEFTLPTPGSEPWGITAGPDGNLWFTEETGNKIGRITTSGVFGEFTAPTSSWPWGITAGPDGNLWFTEYAVNKIGRMTTDGHCDYDDEFTVPTDSSWPAGITAGPDGNIWFTEVSGNQIGRIILVDPI